ncbi:hypothetical protein SALBM217S_08725 [Streptomyces griseoloalbus]
MASEVDLLRPTAALCPGSPPSGVPRGTICRGFPPVRRRAGPRGLRSGPRGREQSVTKVSSVIVPYASSPARVRTAGRLPAARAGPLGALRPARRPPLLPGGAAQVAGRPGGGPAGAGPRCTRARTPSCWSRTARSASVRGAPGCAAGRRWASSPRSTRCRSWTPCCPPSCGSRPPGTTSGGWPSTPTRGRGRTSTWQVPINWFVLFDDEEREYGNGSAGEVPALRYRTPMVQARRRVARGRAARRRGREPADRRPGGRRPLAGGVPSALAGRAGLRATAHALPPGPWRTTTRRPTSARASRRCGGATKGARRRVRAPRRALARGP